MIDISLIRNKDNFICDMDGVIYHGNRLLPGVHEFVDWLYRENKHFLFLTNNSGKTPLELRQKLLGMGLDIGEEHFYTSGLATANFIAKQSPNAKVYVIGEPGLYNAIYEKGLTINDVDPDYVVIGETRTYCFEKLEKAIALVNAGAKLIGANPDTIGVTEKGIMPATGSLVAPIEIATGKKAYFVGKPNPLMLRHGLRKLGCHSEDIAFIGDRMDTDIIAGIESNVDTVLVLSGVTKLEDINDFPYRPKYIADGVGDILK